MVIVYRYSLQVLFISKKLVFRSHIKTELQREIQILFGLSQFVS